MSSQANISPVPQFSVTKTQLKDFAQSGQEDTCVHFITQYLYWFLGWFLDDFKSLGYNNGRLCVQVILIDHNKNEVVNEVSVLLQDNIDLYVDSKNSHNSAHQYFQHQITKCCVAGVTGKFKVVFLSLKKKEIFNTLSNMTLPSFPLQDVLKQQVETMQSTGRIPVLTTPMVFPRITFHGVIDSTAGPSGAGGGGSGGGAGGGGGGGGASTFLPVPRMQLLRSRQLQVRAAHDAQMSSSGEGSKKRRTSSSGEGAAGAGPSAGAGGAAGAGPSAGAGGAAGAGPSAGAGAAGAGPSAGAGGAEDVVDLTKD